MRKYVSLTACVSIRFSGIDVIVWPKPSDSEPATQAAEISLASVQNRLGHSLGHGLSIIVRNNEAAIRAGSESLNGHVDIVLAEVELKDGGEGRLRSRTDRRVQKSIENLTRNSVVSVFLRMMEYC